MHLPLLFHACFTDRLQNNIICLGQVSLKAINSQFSVTQFSLRYLLLLS